MGVFTSRGARVARLAAHGLTALLAIAMLPAVATLTVVLVAPVVAHADANAEARVFFERGNRQLAEALARRGARRTRGLEDALGSYVSSLRIVRSRNAVFNAGVTLQELGRTAEAFGYFVEYRAMSGLSDAERAEVGQRIEAMRPQLALLAIDATPAAEVRLDRRDLAVLGTTPLEIAVSPGEHTLFFTAAGHEERTLTVQAVVGETRPARVTLAAMPGALRVRAPTGALATLDGAPIALDVVVPVASGAHTLRVTVAGRAITERRVEVAPGATLVEVDATRDAPVPAGAGRLEVAVDVAAQVLVDGTRLGAGTRVGGPLGAGTHRVRVEAEGYLPYESTVAVEAGQRTRLEVSLGVDPATVRDLGAWPTVSLVATTSVLTVGLVAALAGLGANANYESAVSDYESGLMDGSSTQADWISLRSRRRQILTLNGLADVLWISSAALGVLTTILYLFDDADAGAGSTGSVTIAPVAGPGYVGGALAWRMP
jgi:NADH:ubiquinone oxidoreductase subunit 3 (subunit A)